MTDKELRTRIERRRRVTFWGERYFITPRLVDQIFGDGGKMIGIAPLSTRPDYYVVRVDSKWDLDNFCTTSSTVAEHTDEILDAIEDQFGRSRYDDDPPQRKHGRPFPALDEECGVKWFEYDLEAEGR